MAPKALRLGRVRWSDAMAVIVRAVAGCAGIPAGFPILLTNCMAIIEPAFAFLLELATVPGRSHSPETLRTYAEHLHDWFDSLEQSAVDWREASEETIAAYRNRMLEQPSPHTGRPYARRSMTGSGLSAVSTVGCTGADGSLSFRSRQLMSGSSPAANSPSWLMLTRGPRSRPQTS